MAKVFVALPGGGNKRLDACTVADVKRDCNASGYQATVNDEPADDSKQLRDGDFIALATRQKGA